MAEKEDKNKDRKKLMWNTGKELKKKDKEKSHEKKDKTSKNSEKISDHLKQKISTVEVNVDAPSQLNLDSPDALNSLGIDNSFSMENFRDNFRIDIISSNAEELIFDMVGVDASIANALRRIMIAEVPTMAIETVYMQDNTSIIQDEVLAHRVGLVPINADPRLFEFKKEQGTVGTEKETLVFKLDITCRRKPGSKEEDEDYENANVYSGHLVWEPTDEQKLDPQLNDIGPVHKDILLAKLRPGQRIALTAHAEKGVGKVHAKWSPVATACYRLLPDPQFKKEMRDEEARKLKAACPMDVFDIEDIGGGHVRAKVARPRDCSMCRECIRPPEWQDKIALLRKKDHFIFQVESVGVYNPEDVMREALKILINKCQNVSVALTNTMKVE